MRASHALSLLLATWALAACTPSDSAPRVLPGPPERFPLIAGSSPFSSFEPVTRLDSDVWEKEIPWPEDLGGHPLVVSTGRASGADQCSLLVVGADATRLSAVRLPAESPYPAPDDVRRTEGERWRQLPQAVRDRTEVIAYGGRVYVALLTIGSYSPSALLLYELDSAWRLIPRLELWSLGHLATFALHGRYLAVLGTDGTRETQPGNYGRAACVLDLDEVLGGSSPHGCVRGVMPQQCEADVGVPAAVVGYFPLPLEPSTEQVPEPVAWSNGAVVASFYDGLEFHIDVASGRVRAEARPEYELRFGAMPRDQRRAPDLQAHLRVLADEAEAAAAAARGRR